MQTKTIGLIIRNYIVTNEVNNLYIWSMQKTTATREFLDKYPELETVHGLKVGDEFEYDGLTSDDGLPHPPTVPLSPPKPE